MPQMLMIAVKYVLLVGSFRNSWIEVFVDITPSPFNPSTHVAGNYGKHVPIISVMLPSVVCIPWLQLKLLLLKIIIFNPKLLLLKLYYREKQWKEPPKKDYTNLFQTILFLSIQINNGN